MYWEKLVHDDQFLRPSLMKICVVKTSTVNDQEWFTMRNIQSTET